MRHGHELAGREAMDDTRLMLMRSALRRVRATTLLTAMAVVLVGCGDAFDRHPQNILQPEGPNARTISNLHNPVFAIAGVVFVVILGACLFIAVRFRARSDADADEYPKQMHGAFKAEITWTIIPALILAAVAVPTVFTIFTLNAEAEPDAVKVEVIGQQWWWEYRYDLDGDGKYDEITTANDLVIPAGRDIALSITSRDVIHSFWVPRLNGKRDAVPNRDHFWRIEADKPGEYVGQCTEYCGLSHAEMRIKAIALTPAKFEAWAAAQQEKASTFEEADTSMAAEGYRLFNQQLCSSCHLIDGVNNTKLGPDGLIKDRNLQVSRHAPELTHLVSRTIFAGGKFDLRRDTAACRTLGVEWASTPANLSLCLNRPALEAWLRNPPAEKPMAADPVPGRTGGRGMPNLNLDETQIDQLVAYLETLK